MRSTWNVGVAVLPIVGSHAYPIGGTVHVLTVAAMMSTCMHGVINYVQ